MATLGSESTPWLNSMATTATMPSDTAIGTLISTSANTAPNRMSMVCMVFASSVQAVGEGHAAMRFRQARAAQHVDQMRQLGHHDHRSGDRYDRLHQVHRYRQADQGIAGKHRHDGDADIPEQQEEQDDQHLGEGID